MQSIKWTMRTVGDSNKVNGAISAEDFSEYVEYSFTANGYKIWKQYEAPIFDADGKSVVAVNLLLTFTKDEEEVAFKKAK